MQGVSSRVPAFFSVPSESFGYFFKSVRDWMFFLRERKTNRSESLVSTRWDGNVYTATAASTNLIEYTHIE